MDEWFYEKNGILYNKVKRKKALVDEKSGATEIRGYNVTFLHGKPYKTHRIIWELNNGPIEQDMQIDHIDGVTTNNKIENLRLVTNKENAENQKLAVNNTSGKIGVSLKSWGGYEVTIAGKYVGSSKSLDKAIAMREQAELEQGYHENHGRLKTN